MREERLTKNQLHRLPDYLWVLKNLESNGLKTVNSQTLADCLDLNNELVRKDIASISSESGVPNKGRKISQLISDIETILGFNRVSNAVLVGVGSLGTAFLHYKGFEDFGLRIVAAFDNNPLAKGKEVNGKPVYDVSQLNEDVLTELSAHIGIITVPGYAAQVVTDALVKAKIKAIWNFAPTKINVPRDIIVSNINLATSLAVLSYELYFKNEKERLKNG